MMKNQGTFFNLIRKQSLRRRATAENEKHCFEFGMINKLKWLLLTEFLTSQYVMDSNKIDRI